MYLTYESYVENGGLLAEVDFNAYEVQAEVIVDTYTFNRLHDETTLPDRLTPLMMRLISLYATKDVAVDINTGDPVVASESNDGVSVTYRHINSTDGSKSIDEMLSLAVKQYLRGVKNSKDQLLLYRGLYEGE